MLRKDIKTLKNELKLKNNQIEKLKNEKFNKSTNDINKYKITSPRNNYCENNIKSNNNQKIEILKNKIYNLMNIIDNFEINFIKDKTPFLIKEKLEEEKDSMKKREEEKIKNIEKARNIKLRRGIILNIKKEDMCYLRPPEFHKAYIGQSYGKPKYAEN